MQRSVLRNFRAFGAAFIVDRVITFLFLVYAARTLGPDVFGQYLLIGTYVMFFSVAFTAGLMPVAVREIMRRRDDPRPVLEQVLSLRLVLGLLAYAMLMLLLSGLFCRPQRFCRWPRSRAPDSSSTLLRTASLPTTLHLNA